jgi:hypothetical protein
MQTQNGTNLHAHWWTLVRGDPNESTLDLTDGMEFRTCGVVCIALDHYGLALVLLEEGASSTNLLLWTVEMVSSGAITCLVKKRC